MEAAALQDAFYHINKPIATSLHTLQVLINQQYRQTAEMSFCKFVLSGRAKM